MEARAAQATKDCNRTRESPLQSMDCKEKCNSLRSGILCFL